jgi:hypothetical protein
VKPARRLGLLLAFAALVLQAAVPLYAHGESLPSDYCSTPGSSAASQAGGGDAGGAGSPGSCPCCRLHAVPAVTRQPPLLLPACLAVEEAPRAARAQAPFDAFFAWRRLLTQGPPAVP